MIFPTCTSQGRTPCLAEGSGMRAPSAQPQPRTVPGQFPSSGSWTVPELWPHGREGGTASFRQLVYRALGAMAFASPGTHANELVSNVEQEYLKTSDRNIHNIHILHTIYGHTHDNICYIYKAYSIYNERMHACH